MNAYLLSQTLSQAWATFSVVMAVALVCYFARNWPPQLAKLRFQLVTALAVIFAVLGIREWLAATVVSDSPGELASKIIANVAGLFVIRALSYELYRNKLTYVIAVGMLMACGVGYFFENETAFIIVAVGMALASGGAGILWGLRSDLEMFKLSDRSLRNLEGVHPDLVKVVERAIQISDVDFGVGEGLRSQEKQDKEVAEGNSRTRNSRHLDGHAVDLICYIDGKMSWDWPMYGRIALAMKHASKELNIPLNWGGVWDKELSELSDAPYNDHVDYMERFLKANGRHALADGPHFQLTRKAYPS